MQEEKGSGEPGGARFGNFINYYEFNPPQQRLDLLPEDLLSNLSAAGTPSVDQEEDDRPLHILDVGCNAGNLTAAIVAKYGTGGRRLKILGVDIDEQLISRAIANYSNDDLSFRCINIMDQDAPAAIRDYLKSNNVQQFDLITVFSVTMWIHLHHGDSGLTRFLQILHEFGGNVLLEPQPWKCYQTAARRMRKLGSEKFPAMENLTMRGEQLEPGLLHTARECGLEEQRRFGETKWNRKLILFKSTKNCS